MFYKKFSVFCFAALLAMQTAVCSATVPQDADNDAKPKVLNQRVLQQAEKKAQKQAKQAAKKAPAKKPAAKKAAAKKPAAKKAAKKTEPEDDLPF